MNYDKKVEMKIKLLHLRAYEISFNGLSEKDFKILEIEKQIKKLDLIYFKEYHKK